MAEYDAAPPMVSVPPEAEQAKAPMRAKTSKGARWSELPDRAEPQAVASVISSKISQARALRRHEETSWYIDVKYVSGDQWVSWDPRKKNLYVRPKKPWRIRQTINHLRPDMEVLIDVLTSRTGKPISTPANSDPEAKAGSRAATKLYKHLWNSLDMDDVADELAMWTLVCGIGVLKVSWDAQAGEIMELPDYDAIPEGGTPGPGFETPTVEIPIGEIHTDIIPTFNFFIDPSATSERRARWMADVGYMHAGEARARWPEQADDIAADGGRDVWFNYTKRLMYASGSGGSDEVANSTTVITFYSRPDGENPRGRQVTVAGGVVVEDTEMPAGKFPYAIFRCYRNLGSFLCQSAANVARNTQKSLNSYRSLVMEHFVKGGNTQWLVAKGSGVKRSDLTDEPGNAIFYNPTGVDPIKPLPPSMMPPGWQDLMTLDRSDLHDQTGAVDVLRGENATGMRAGRNFAYAVEQVMAKLRPLVKRFGRGYTQMARVWLAYAQEFYEEDRILRIMGQSGGVETFMLKVADIRSADDIIIDSESMMPESKAARRDEVLQLWSAGLIVDESGMPDSKRALDLMQYTSTSDTELMNPDEDDRSWAREENLLMASGQQVLPEPHDNHPLHAAEHVSFMRTAQYRQLPPEIRQIFRQHLDATIEMMQAAMAPPPGEELGGEEPGGGDMRGGGTPAEPRTDRAGGPT